MNVLIPDQEFVTNITTRNMNIGGESITLLTISSNLDEYADIYINTMAECRSGRKCIAAK